MGRPWRPFSQNRRGNATPMRSPDFVKIAEAHDLPGVRVTGREGTMAAIRHARASAGPVLIEFRVAPEDADYPMVSPGAARHEMPEAPRSPLTGTGADLL